MHEGIFLKIMYVCGIWCRVGVVSGLGRWGGIVVLFVCLL